MKKGSLICTILLLSTIVIANIPALLGSSSIKPNYTLPQSWYVGDESLGIITLRNELDSEYIFLLYQEAQGPETATSLEAKAFALFQEYRIHDPTETGIMTIGDSTAGYAKYFRDYGSKSYDFCVVFVKGNTLIEIVSRYGSTIYDWVEISNFLNSITAFNGTPVDGTTVDIIGIIQDSMLIIISLLAIVIITVVIIVIRRKRRKRSWFENIKT